MPNWRETSLFDANPFRTIHSDSGRFPFDSIRFELNARSAAADASAAIVPIAFGRVLFWSGLAWSGVGVGDGDGVEAGVWSHHLVLWQMRCDLGDLKAYFKIKLYLKEVRNAVLIFLGFNVKICY